MLSTFVIVLLILWLLGLVTSYTLGGPIDRREYELAGGGAPSERGIIRRANAIERLYDLLRRGSGRHHDTPREAPLPRPNRIEST